MAECHNCGGRVDGDPTVCPDCGASRRAGDKTNICRTCGGLVAGTAKTCPHCGDTFATLAVGGNTMIDAGLRIALLVVVGIILLAVLRFCGVIDG